MSDKIHQFERWNAARDKAKRAAEENDDGLAVFYTRIAKRIETRFFAAFGESLGAFALSYLG